MCKNSFRDLPLRNKKRYNSSKHHSCIVIVNAPSPLFGPITSRRFRTDGANSKVTLDRVKGFLAGHIHLNDWPKASPSLVKINATLAIYQPGKICVSK